MITITEILSSEYNGALRTNENGRNGSKGIKFSELICCFCHLPIAPYEKRVETKKGPAHYSPCALREAIKKIDKAELPRPTQFGEPWQLLTHLETQAELLLKKPANSSEYEEQLATILAIAENFQEPLKLSRMAAR